MTSAEIFLLRSPLATAVVTSAMSRTCPVRLPAIRLTLSVRSFQTPPTSIVTAAAWPSLPSVPTSRTTRVTSETKPLSWSTIALTVFLSSSISRARHRDLLAQVPVGDGSDDALHLAGGAHEILDQAVDRLGGRRPDLIGPAQRHALGELALLADDAADLGQFDPQRLICGDDVVEAVGDLARHSRPPQRHPHAEIAVLDLRQTLNSTVSSSSSVVRVIEPSRAASGGRRCRTAQSARR